MYDYPVFGFCFSLKEASNSFRLQFTIHTFNLQGRLDIEYPFQFEGGAVGCIVKR